MEDSYPNFLGTPRHKLSTCLSRFDSLVLFGRLSTGDRMSYESDEF
jgi:hypothetical protein